MQDEQVLYSIFIVVLTGTNPGGLDVLSWLETTDTEIEITDINSSFTHYLSISAISQNGLYVTSTFTVKY